jgi:hypothetical protein
MSDRFDEFGVGFRGSEDQGAGRCPEAVLVGDSGEFFADLGVPGHGQVIIGGKVQHRPTLAKRPSGAQGSAGDEEASESLVLAALQIFGKRAPEVHWVDHYW